MEIFKMVYEINKKEEIKICNSSFLNKNKKKIKMIINNRIVPLRDKYIIIDETMTTLKVKFKILIEQKLNLKSMFYGCFALKEFHSIINQNKSCPTKKLYYNQNNNALNFNYTEENNKLSEKIEKENLYNNNIPEENNENLQYRSKFLLSNKNEHKI